MEKKNLYFKTTLLSTLLQYFAENLSITYKKVI